LVEQSCCFTGHRQIPKEEIPKLKKSLEKEIKRLIKKGYKYFICGGALGFDTLAALTIIELRKKYKNIMLMLVIPCRDQASKWREEDISLYNDIISKADSVKTLSKVYYPGIMQIRNTYMVDNSSVCIAYLRKATGGTASTVKYTQKGEYGRKIECIML